MTTEDIDYRHSSLSRRIAEGDGAAENELVKLFSAGLTSFARNMTHDADFAQDIAQETIFAAILALRQNHLRNPERLASYVFGIGRKVLWRRLRERNRLSEPLPRDLSEPPSIPAEEPPVFAELRAAMRGLQESDRYLLHLILTEELKPREVARRMGVSSEAIRQRKSRALKRIAQRVLVGRAAASQASIAGSAL